jgi:membrane protease YdiL (CAAX protease family)
MLMNWQVGWITLEPSRRGWSLIAKLGRASLTPLPLALMEELVFRGIILEQLSRSFPGTIPGQGVALTLSAALFGAVHFFKEQKRVLLPAVGLFALGWMLGFVYLISGHTIWIPAAFHAAGVWFIQLTRPFASYEGPAWLIGYRSYPICGVFGLTVMSLLLSWVLVML